MNRENAWAWIGLAAVILAAAIVAHYSCPTCQERLRTWWARR